jgi:hypothetical protein
MKSEDDMAECRNKRKRNLCQCGFCRPLREIRRRIVAEFRSRGNEQARLDELIEADPPKGGMDGYIAYLNGNRE